MRMSMIKPHMRKKDLTEIGLILFPTRKVKPKPVVTRVACIASSSDWFILLF